MTIFEISNFSYKKLLFIFQGFIASNPIDLANKLDCKNPVYNVFKVKLPLKRRK